MSEPSSAQPPYTHELLRQVAPLAAPYVVLAIGIPGSGKTTEMQMLAEQTGAAYISSDDTRKYLLGDPSNKTLDIVVYHNMHTRAKAQILDGKSVIIDETHTDPERRKQAIRVLRGAGATAIFGVLFDVTLEEAKARNKLRERFVPDEVLEEKHQSLQDTPPSIEEGFDTIIPISSLPASDRGANIKRSA